MPEEELKRIINLIHFIIINQIFTGISTFDYFNSIEVSILSIIHSWHMPDGHEEYLDLEKLNSPDDVPSSKKYKNFRNIQKRSRREMKIDSQKSSIYDLEHNTDLSSKDVKKFIKHDRKLQSRLRDCDRRSARTAKFASRW